MDQYFCVKISTRAVKHTYTCICIVYVCRSPSTMRLLVTFSIIEIELFTLAEYFLYLITASQLTGPLSIIAGSLMVSTLCNVIRGELGVTLSVFIEYFSLLLRISLSLCFQTISRFGAPVALQVNCCVMGSLVLGGTTKIWSSVMYRIVGCSACTYTK